MPFTPTAQYANNVTLVLQCHECEKWRPIYSNNHLSPQERLDLSQFLEAVQYSCASLDRLKPYTKLFLATSVIGLTKFSIFIFRKHHRRKKSSSKSSQFSPASLKIAWRLMVVNAYTGGTGRVNVLNNWY